MERLREPLGISPSPILAPDGDVTGQLRVDDPDVEPPSGLGENVFIDRGAIDRSDFIGPTISLLTPRDNDSEGLDQNLAPGVLLLPADTILSNFRIELLDGVLPADSQDGIGVDDLTVVSNAVTITQNGVPLEEGTDYSFSYNATSDTIVLTPGSGIWEPDKVYVITFNNQDRFQLVADSGDMILDGDSFVIFDQNFTDETFEFESGFTIFVPQTLTMTVPPEAGGVGGVADGDTFSVTNGLITVNFEFDSNGTLTNSNNTPIDFSSQSTVDDIANEIVATLASVSLGLNPVNLTDGVIHLGSNANHGINTLNSPTLTVVGTPGGIADGDVFIVDDGSSLTIFEFDTDNVFSANTEVIRYDTSDTYEDIAAEIAIVVENADVGLTPIVVDNGAVNLGGTEQHILDTSQSNLTQFGTPGVRPEFGIQIPTTAGFPNGIFDGQTFELSNGINTVTFQFDTDDSVVPRTDVPVVIPFFASADAIASAMVAAIANENLGLSPVYNGNGVITLGGNASHTLLIPVDTALIQLGQPGVPAAIPVEYTPSSSFNATQMAVQLIDAINSSTRLDGVTAKPGEGDMVVVEGAVGIFDFNGAFVSGTFIGAIRDLAGNTLKPNQFSGETKVTIVLGDVDLDFGDAVDPSFPTLFGSNGAVHVAGESVPGQRNRCRVGRATGAAVRR